MSGSFYGIEQGMRALMAARASSELTGRNIANANTEGYSRQELKQDPKAVQLSAFVLRYRDDFLDKRFRMANQDLGYWQLTNKSSSRIEESINEPSESGLSSQIDSFFGGWQDVANDAQGSAPRTSLISFGQNLASRFQQLNTAFNTERANMEDVVVRRVGEINDYADQIAALNFQIAGAKSLGTQPNDLLDKRDVLIDKLAKTVGITYSEDTFGNINIKIGTTNLVSGDVASDLTTNLVAGYSQVVWQSTMTAATITSGEIAAAMKQRDTAIPALQTKLDSLASTIISQVNAIHSTGYALDGSTGRPFFSGTNAATIDVNATLVADPRLIAAAGVAGAPSDGTKALAIGNLVESLTMGGTSTFNAYWNAFVAQLGVDTRQAKNLNDSYDLVVTSTTNERASLSGVSIDEEAANLVKFQHAYNAAAKMISTVDEMLDKVINGMGSVGR